MRKDEIKVGGFYVAKVGTNITTVRVDAIREIRNVLGFGTARDCVRYEVTNMKTGRKTTFRSVAKFRSRAVDPKSKYPTPDIAKLAADLAPQPIDRRGQPGQPPLPTITHTTDGDGKADQVINAVGQQAVYGFDEYTIDEDGNEVETTREERNDLLASELAVENSLLGKITNKTIVIPEADEMVADPKFLEIMKNTRSIYDASYADKVRTLEGVVPLTGLAARLAASATVPPHVIVEARAGTGKTFTIVVGIVNTFKHKVPGMWDQLVQQLGFNPVPSVQQKAVWDAMALSADAKTIQMTAFNKSIVNEFESKWGWVIKALAGAGITLQFATNHSMGYAAVRKAFPRRLEVSQYRVMDLIASITGTDVRELRKTKMMMVKATQELVGLCKMNLTDVGDPEALDRLISHYDIDVNGYHVRGDVMSLTPQVLEACKDPTRDGRLDYDDMIWLPCVLDLPVHKHDLLLVDEAQDLNRCQQALAYKAGKRIVMVGDPRQAIYGFAGADAESMPRLKQVLGATDQGCIVLPLTVTRRCGHAIVAEANKIVPDFQAHESNHPGTINEANYPTREVNGKTEELPWDQTYMAQAGPGDFVLCRVNAPLVNNCFRFLKRGIKASIQGRDIGAGLITTIEKLKATSINDLAAKVSNWLEAEQSKENAKRLPSESRLIALQDRADCLVAFMEGQTTVDGVISRIKSIFTDDKQGNGIKLSSVHRAKGLEANRVFIIMPKGANMPHPMARSSWQMEQEMNLKYVAITRAIRELVWVF